ncbi:hypothetical protein GCM10010191_06120 [Actinomadura vinacea]|uniref:Protein kinase domain-containing protein n=1 Tax=Actinomadura vinacea TaxID=115336 RepID=A0ABN3IDD1_9ACTN
MPATRPADPKRVGPYRVTGRLGAGGMGQVLLARSPGGRAVAVKIIHPALADEPNFRSRFRREVTAARAVDGAYTAAVLDADPDAPQPWLATAFLPGLSLQDAVAAHGPLPAPAARALGAGLAEALLSIHRAGVVHRDLKPANVMLTPAGPRVIDFGIARASDASALTRTGATLGTPAYMSPEQASGEPAGPAADVFSLGAVLTYALTGSGPFGGGAVHEVIYRVIHLQPDLSAIGDPGLRVLIASCLDKDPARRPDPGQLLRSLAGGAAAPPDGTHWLPPQVAHAVAQRGAEPVSRGPGRRTFLALGAGGAAVLLTAGGGTAGVLLARDDSPLRWTFDLPGDLTVRGGTMAAAGTVLAVGAERGDARTFAFDPRTGERRWEGAFSATQGSPLAVVGGTGLVCDIGGLSTALTGFDIATGRRLWSAGLSTFATAPVPVAAAGAFCLAGSDGTGSYGLFAFDAATGRQRWRYRSEMVQGNVAQAGGTCYFADQGGFLYAVDAATGGARWRRRVAERLPATTPAVAGGVVTLVAGDGSVHAFDAATGRPRWRQADAPDGGAGPPSAELGVLPPLMAGDAVYVGGQTGLTVLDARTGRQRWRFGTASAVGSAAFQEHRTPVLGRGLAFLADGQETLTALEAATGRVRWRRTVGKGFGERPMIAGNVVFHAGVDGVHGFDLVTGRPRYRLGKDDVPEDSMSSAKGLSALGSTVYCTVGSTLVCALRPPGD